MRASAIVGLVLGGYGSRQAEVFALLNEIFGFPRKRAIAERIELTYLICLSLGEATYDLFSHNFKEEFFRGEFLHRCTMSAMLAKDVQSSVFFIFKNLALASVGIETMSTTKLAHLVPQLRENVVEHDAVAEKNIAALKPVLPQFIVTLLTECAQATQQQLVHADPGGFNQLVRQIIAATEIDLWQKAMLREQNVVVHQHQPSPMSTSSSSTSSSSSSLALTPLPFDWNTFLPDILSRCDTFVGGGEKFDDGLLYASSLSLLYASLIRLSQSQFSMLQRSPEWNVVVACNNKVFVAYQNLVRRCIDERNADNKPMPPVFLSHTGEKSLSGKAEDKDYTQLVEILLKMRDIVAFLDVNETHGVPYARPFDIAVRQGVIGCKVGVVVLTDLFVGKQWPVFEWFLFEARTVVDPSFRLLYDVCVHDDQVRWFQLGWPNGTRWFEGKIT